MDQSDPRCRSVAVKVVGSHYEKQVEETCESRRHQKGSLAPRVAPAQSHKETKAVSPSSYPIDIGNEDAMTRSLGDTLVLLYPGCTPADRLMLAHDVRFITIAKHLVEV
ncbi:unnamed protein product [Boreogadus saida]